MGKNGYFTFEKKVDGLYMNIIPPKEDGVSASIEDVMYVLEKKKIRYADLVSIKSAITRNELTQVRLGENGYYSEGEWIDISVSQDGLVAVARFFPPFVNGSLLTKDEIINELREAKIVSGIMHSNIDLFLNEREYGKKYVIAAGRKAIEGKDAVLTYNFNLEKSVLPKIKEDGNVDFYDLDNINHVKEGDVVAEIKKEVEGKPGIDVHGNPIMPRAVSRKIFRYGRGLKVSENGLQLISEISGHVTLDGDRVSVSNTYMVASDVGFGTGNIEFDGNVTVPGNVTTGFVVKATGDIEVRGIVEGATLIAGGNVVLGRGMNGMHHGVIRAGKAIIAKFIENAKEVEAGERIEVGAIMHSNVSSGGEIVVEGKNGLITGGKVMATKLVSAKNIGSHMGTNTEITVGISPTIKNRAEELKKSIKKYNDEKEKLSQVITMLIKKSDSVQLDENKRGMMRKSKESYDIVSEELSKCVEEYNKVTELLQEESEACVKVLGTVYPGVKVTIGECELRIKDVNKFCQFRKDGVDVKKCIL